MNPKRPVSLEDLLRVKRAERPSAQFWADYDRQLRSKQLAALVGKRPWWYGLRNGIVGLARLHVAVGAAAVLAVSFISLREAPRAASIGPAAGDAPMRELESAQVAVVPGAVVAPAELPVQATAAAQISVPTAETLVAMVEPSVSADGPGVSGLEAAVAAPRSPMVGSEGLLGDIAVDSPSARYIAANLAAAQEGVGTALLSDMQGFELRGITARGAKIDPLQQMTPPGENRRANRLLTAMVSTTVADASFRSTERVANRISPEELYDQVRRFGTRHGGLNVRF